MLKEGMWWFSSDSDPRFKGNGEGLVGMHGIPHDCQETVNRLCELYECDPPEDLMFGYEKY